MDKLHDQLAEALGRMRREIVQLLGPIDCEPTDLLSEVPCISEADAALAAYHIAKEQSNGQS